jgi:NAD(P)-dependent dehydrogenase (short-subunit alcohol dehydrogenase family)
MNDDADPVVAARPLAGKSCVVTGGTGGIGFVAAQHLATDGAAVIIVGRDAERGASAAAAIRQAASNPAVEYIPADLSDQGNLRRLAQRISEREPRLDVLVNNAGGLFGRRRLSVDGIEMTFALNHLNYFLLSHLLLPLLERSAQERSAPARIVTVASQAHKGVTLDFDDLQGEENYNRWHAYKRSKLANIMFTYELARRIDGRGVTVNALHPGFVATGIGARHGFIPGALWWIGKQWAISPEEGARTLVHLAASPEVEGVNGQYFIDCQPRRSSSASYDSDAASRLWDVSLNLTGLNRRRSQP